jgi:hypothetical protein
MIVQPTTDPAEGPTLVRMASIPHGTTIVAQGTSSTTSGKPTIPTVDITPFGMAFQITDDHIATFATGESTWDGLADALIDKYEGIATRIVLYNALGNHERFERYGEVAQRISTRRPSGPAHTARLNVSQPSTPPTR